MQGKSEEGHICLKVEEQKNRVRIQVSDDGRGLDPAHLKSVAYKNGIITSQEVASFTKDEAIALIFRPGFSTAVEVNEVSGRGVGMDAVLTSVTERLCGKILIDSEVGKGTTFTIEIPLKNTTDDPPTEIEEILAVV
jgi:two-component system chemotaxis sensor kinase CheA